MEAGRASQGKRPFDHPEFPDAKLKDLDGQAYKFSIIFPVSEKGRKIFDEGDRAALVALLTNDFGGCTLTNDVTHPLMQGTWVGAEGQVMKGNHSQIYVYASQSEESVEYFRHLKKTLEKMSGEQEILVEMTPVVLYCSYPKKCEVPPPTPSKAEMKETTL